MVEMQPVYMPCEISNINLVIMVQLFVTIAQIFHLNMMILACQFMILLFRISDKVLLPTNSLLSSFTEKHFSCTPPTKAS